MSIDEQNLREEEARILAEQESQGGTGEGAGEHGEAAGGEGEGGKSRLQQRIDQLVAARKAAEERATVAERTAGEALAAAETAERIARERSGSRDTERVLSIPERREQVKRRFRAGEIDDDTRVEQLADLAAEERLAAADQVSGVRQVLHGVATEIEGWKRLAPEINQPGSTLNTRVSEAYARLVGRGAPADVRTQLTAVEQVMGGTIEEHQRRRTVDDYTAESLPRGGVGTGGSGGEGQRRGSGQGTYGEQLYARLTPDALAEMRRLYNSAPDPDAAIKKDLEYADEETLWRRGRLKSR